MWGKLKTTGDDWMYPKPVMDLSGWNIRCMDSGNMHHVIGADDACISWGHAQYGELGYGPLGPKSSSNPKKVEILDHMHVMSAACGLGLSLIVVDRAKAGDRLEQLDIYEGDAAVQGDAGDEGQDETVATEKKTPRKVAGNSPANSRKRKNKESSSESEDMEDEYEDSDSNEDSDDENGDINSASHKVGGKSSSKGRGRGAKKPATETKNSGRGRGRPKKTDKSLEQHEAANTSSGRRGRGRPRKNQR